MYLVNLLITLVTSQLANFVLKHGVLLIEVVYRFFALCIIVHRRFEEEAEEALYAIFASTGSKVAEQTEVEQQRCCEDRITAEEIDFYLHGIAHPSKDIDVVPSFLIIVSGRIIVDAHLMIILCIFVVAMAIEVGLQFWFENGLEG